MNILQLNVFDFVSQDSWRWVLADAGGSMKETHAVTLRRDDPAYAAFVDLYRTLRYSSAPDRDPVREETRILNQLGEWISACVFGPIAQKLVEASPVTVFVNVPLRGETLLYRPFELAQVHGLPIAGQRVTLVYHRADCQGVRSKHAIGRALRVLAIFSLPSDAAALNLRRERYALEEMIRSIARRDHLAIEFRAMQYGTGRDRLREVLSEPEGWDIVHFSGHGLPGTVVLEKQDGASDVLPTGDLLEMLLPIRHRVKLVMVSACESAAPALRAASARLGLDPAAEWDVDPEANPVAQTETGLAWTLAQALDCAVLAMRFPVADEFAAAFSSAFYETLFARGLSVPEALQEALALSPAGPLAAGTPALFAWSPSDQPLTAPRGDVAQPGRQTGDLPPASEYFVGRVHHIARSAAALAPGSGFTGVLFYGMAGAGKTACAVELVRSYDTSPFDAVVWFKAPDEGADTSRALLQLALAMEGSMRDFQMVHAVEYLDEFNVRLPTLTHQLAERPILIVLDNLESLLARDGTWLDSRWKSLAAALLAHDGASRVVMTCRRRPVEIGDDARVLSLPVQPLSLSESILLAGQLPNLGPLLHSASDVLLRIVNKTQGHPKLMALADKQVARPETLGRLLDTTIEDFPDAPIQPFLRGERSSLGVGEFAATLEKWTGEVAASLSAAALLAFQFLCALEEEDRDALLIATSWPGMWLASRQPGDAPDPQALLRDVAVAGLVELSPDDAACRVHPAVAHTGRAQAGHEFTHVVCVVMAGVWAAQSREYRAREASQAGVTDGVISASLRAVPYCLRLRNWEAAAAMLQPVLDRDRSPAILDLVLPWVRRIVAETDGTREGRENAGLLAKALYSARRLTEAENVLRALIENTLKAGETEIAFAAISDLADVLSETGRRDEALRTLAQAQALRGGGLPLVDELADQAQSLQMLAGAGSHSEVLETARRLLGILNSLPEQMGDQGRATSWNVREMILSVARRSAMELQKHGEALEFNAGLLRSQRRRGAPVLEQAMSRYHDYQPLLRLGRLNEARQVLQESRQVFEAEDDLLGLAAVFSGLAEMEQELGNTVQAVNFAEASLRHSYKGHDPEHCGVGHLRLASCVEARANDPNVTLSNADYLAAVQVSAAHVAAAGVIFLELQSEEPGQDLRRWTPNLMRAILELASQVGLLAKFAPLPATFDELCRVVEQTEGVRFRTLYKTLSHRYASGDKAMGVVIHLAWYLATKANQRG